MNTTSVLELLVAMLVAYLTLLFMQRFAPWVFWIH